MPLTTVAVSPAGAYPALAEAIATAKGGDALTPVTVVVPTNAAGVTARRWLGRRRNPWGVGVAGVDMLTLGRVAELLAGPALAAAGRRPVSVPVVELTLAGLLAGDPGQFGPVASHSSTVAALRELHDELRLAGPGAPNRLAAASGRGRAAATVSLRLTERLAPRWYDTADVLAGAAAAAVAGPLPPRLERLVVFLPRPPHGLEQALLDALAEHAEVTLIEYERHDTSTIDTSSASTDVTTPERARVVSATDADEEVRHAVRTVVDAARDGVPFGRMAILWPTDDPYARLVEHHLATAELPWNGRPGRDAAERVVPRFLLDLLDVDRRGLRRSDLFDLLSDLELHHPGGGRLPVARWERVARKAGVAAAADWRPRLTMFAERERARAAAAGFESAFAADDADDLARYVTELSRALGRRDRARPWAEWVEWCVAQVDQRLGEAFLSRLPEAEQLAWLHTTAVLDRLSTLDTVSAPVTRGAFREVFAAEFDAAPGRLGRIGEGVTVGSLAGVTAPDFDLVVIVGAAEGLMPPAPSSGPLIGDADRAAAGMPSSEATAERMRRAMLALVGTTRQLVVARPRGDLRGAAERHPSRWLAAYLPAATTYDLASHHAALRDTPFPAHATEHRLRAALHDGPAARSDDIVLTAALRTRAARRAASITEFDGDLSGIPIRHFERPVAPTRIEQWVACPHGYFMRYVLGVYPLDDPQAELEIAAAERGNVIHDTLDLLHREVLDEALPQPAGGWQDAHLERALELFDQVAARFEATGRTGRPASWAVERALLRNDLLGWFAADSRRLAATGATIVSSEAGFGDDGSVHLALPGGQLAVKGRIDRVDRTSTGALVVVDHKTGTKRSYQDISPDDPTAGGSRFQLPVYAAGALALADGGSDVEAYYSFFARGQYGQVGYRFTPEVQAEVTARLGELVAGVESGLFPARPAKPGFQLFIECEYCQPDRLGTAERWPEWERKRHDPRGARWFADPDEVNTA
ncbi:MAG TPA: PD-(D/E)XK nuclease family protein [Ilumatobacter sp.]|nr:PD-(D/E)XK nuclease family protein [Ilumatobacter sp.]